MSPLELVMMVAVVSIPLTWDTFKWAGPILFLASLVALFTGALPDNPGAGFGNGLRWVAWPLFAFWILVCIGRGILSY